MNVGYSDVFKKHSFKDTSSLSPMYSLCFPAQASLWDKGVYFFVKSKRVKYMTCNYVLKILIDKLLLYKRNKALVIEF